MFIISKINRTAEKIISPIVGSALLFITLLLFFNVVGRYVFGYSLKWGEELTNYVIIWITLLGGVVCLRKGMQISMDAFVLQLNDTLKNFVKRLTNSIGLAFSLVITWLGIKLVASIFSYGQVSPAMMIPIYIPYLILPLSGFFMALEFLELVIQGTPPSLPVSRGNEKSNK